MYFVWAVELNRYGLEFVGLWPTIDKAAKHSYISNLRAYISFIIITFVCVIPLICSLIRVLNDIILVIDNLQFTLPIMVVLFKFIIMRWKQTALLSILNMMANDWIAIKIDTQRDVMLKWARTARFIVICGYTMIGCAAIIAILFPYFGVPFRRLSNLTDSDKPLPIQGYYFYDTDLSPQFELTFISQAIMIILAAVIYTSVDALLGLVILHTCGQLENFKYHLASMAASDNFDSALRNSVIIHIRLIRFSNKIEDMFALMLLGLVVYFAIVFCLYGFLLLSVMTDEQISDVPLSRICYMIVTITIFLAHTFLYCGAGELMTEHTKIIQIGIYINNHSCLELNYKIPVLYVCTCQCDAIYEAICDLDWYKLNSRRERNLMLLMIRASEPFRITAGKVVPLTMTTFCSRFLFFVMIVLNLWVTIKSDCTGCVSRKKNVNEICKDSKNLMDKGRSYVRDVNL
ncbi:odorant receptor 13a isoform X2 [Ooceraea biroi]|uniref:odorant receptor 13a isoform X2 n=1 Tax=Ooceraea biroi TaxID=2015173 RepID=UPI000F092384|nr:odorant receptor 13a isoform X2 [Ooceraea biroi]